MVLEYHCKLIGGLLCLILRLTATAGTYFVKYILLLLYLNNCRNLATD